MYLAVHDATSRVLTAAFGKTRGAPKLWYLEPDVRASGLTGAELEDAVDRIGARFPGRVKTTTRSN